MFFRDFRHPALCMLAQRLAGVDLMTRDPNVHRCWLLSLAARLRPRASSRQPAC
jgi:hypothetical protein